MGDRLVVLEPFISLSDRLAFRIAQSVPVLFGGDQGFQQMHHGGELAGTELVKQPVGVLSISGYFHSAIWASKFSLTRRQPLRRQGQRSHPLPRGVEDRITHRRRNP